MSLGTRIAQIQSIYIIAYQHAFDIFNPLPEPLVGWDVGQIIGTCMHR